MELESLPKDKLKTLKPNECGIIYDEIRGLLIGICNKNGEIIKKRRKLRRFEWKS